jgi:single-stranded DNA-binding protein
MNNPNDAKLWIELSKGDAVLLEGTLRMYRMTFQEAGNDVMVQFLDEISDKLHVAVACCQ